jgi:hypothetical protein
MLPSQDRLPLDIVTEELERCNVYLLETFQDGQTRWGSDNQLNPFSGSSAVADTYDQTICLTDVRGILHRLDRSGHFDVLVERIENRLRDRKRGA